MIASLEKSGTPLPPACGTLGHGVARRLRTVSIDGFPVAPGILAARIASLWCAMLIYGLFGEPAPVRPGIPEVAVALLLAGAIGFRRIVLVGTGAIIAAPSSNLAERVGGAAFVLLLWLPLVRGLAVGWAVSDIVRDIVGLLFLFLPLALPSEKGDERRMIGVLTGAVAMVGVLFALRWWIDAGLAFADIGRRPFPEGSGYLINSPAVLFAAVWLPLAAVRPADRLCAIPLRIGLAMAALLCITAVAATTHRLALVIVVAVLVPAFLAVILRRPMLVLPVLVVAALAGWMLGDMAADVFDRLVTKTRLVGLNARGAEFAAVLETVGRSGVSALIGGGWGALMENPAVGGWRVSFTHNLVSAMLLKAGLIGTLALGAYLTALGAHAGGAIRRLSFPALAILAPLVMGMLAHTSYKSLSFGMLLTAFALILRTGYRDRGPLQS